MGFGELKLTGVGPASFDYCDCILRRLRLERFVGPRLLPRVDDLAVLDHVVQVHVGVLAHLDGDVAADQFVGQFLERVLDVRALQFLEAQLGHVALEERRALMLDSARPEDVVEGRDLLALLVAFVADLKENLDGLRAVRLRVEDGPLDDDGLVFPAGDVGATGGGGVVEG